ncbi:MAG TPA: biotin/lipoyl-containing protein [Gemmatimonadales bacterium]|nr:biotin/lipoyl-containing protein [Gemmatimonadales bacterium]
MRYFVTVAGREHQVEVDGDRLLVDGEPVQASGAALPGTPVRQVLVDGASWMLTVDPAGQGRWEIGWRGDRWEVEVVDERTRHIRSLTGAGQARGGGGLLRAPMPGLVVRVLVGPGDRVEPGQGVVVLEAMKMENELKAAGPGVVKAVRAEVGRPVEKGEVLVELDG